MTDATAPPSEPTPNVGGYGPGHDKPVDTTKTPPAAPTGGSTRYDDGYRDATQEAERERKDRAIRRLFKAGLVMSGLLLLGALILTVYTAWYMSTAASEADDWAGLGYVFAVAITVPTLLALGVSGLGVKVRHRSPNWGLALTVVGVVGTCFIFLTMASMGLAFFPS